MTRQWWPFGVAVVCLLLAACDHVPSWMGGNKPEAKKLPGDRVTVLSREKVLSPDATLAGVPVKLPPPFDNPGWPQHTGVITASTGNLALKGTLSEESSARVGDGETFEHPLVPRPVVADGTVFAMDAVGYISAHDADDVTHIRWKSKGVSEEDEPDILGGGLAYDQGRLYATSGRGVVAAFDAGNGNEIWRKTLHTPFRSAPRAAHGKLYAITIDSQLVALDIATGEALWTHRGINETAGLMNSLSPAAAGSIVIVPYASGEIYALSEAIGTPLWGDSLAQTERTQASAAFAGIGGDPVVDGEVVFAVSTAGRLAVFGLATGQRLWDLPVSSINTPWVAGNHLFILTTDNTLACLVKFTGQVMWAVKLPGFEDEENRAYPIVWQGPVLADNKLIVVGSNEEMLLISAADGSVLETKSSPDEVTTAPIVANGRVYMVGQDATLYSLQ